MTHEQHPKVIAVWMAPCALASSRGCFTRLEQRAANRRVYQLNPSGVGVLHAQIERFWSKALATFKEIAEQPLEEES